MPWLLGLVLLALFVLCASIALEIWHLHRIYRQEVEEAEALDRLARAYHEVAGEPPPGRMLRTPSR